MAHCPTVKILKSLFLNSFPQTPSYNFSTRAPQGASELFAANTLPQTFFFFYQQAGLRSSPPHKQLLGPTVNPHWEQFCVNGMHCTTVEILNSLFLNTCPQTPSHNYNARATFHKCPKPQMHHGYPCKFPLGVQISNYGYSSKN